MVEDSLTLDLGLLLRQESIRPLRHVRGVLSWSSQRDGEVLATIGYESSLPEQGCGWLRLKYRHNDLPKEYAIQITTTVPNYGGLRRWFVCPLSNDRAAKLYLPPGGTVFGSRNAYGLAYRSQSQSLPDRIAEKAHSLRQKIGGEPGFHQPMSRKPKGMYWRTYMRMRDEISRLEDASMMAMAQSLGICVDLRRPSRCPFSLVGSLKGTRWREEQEADESEEAFERTLQKIVKPPLKKDGVKDDR
ncbi:hypothetical protein [Minwuia sp. IMCC3060]|uniref:hypothetical protein n=1 Tax=Minwuia sp. IMCC3060 TaxID=3040675 RepID=UPI00247A6073|nr:hypothetical protein [Minwuia sp. IMCC3060]